MCGATAWSIAASATFLDESISSRELYDRLLVRAIEAATTPAEGVSEAAPRGPGGAPPAPEN